jgi:hypothetical protein
MADETEVKRLPPIKRTTYSGVNYAVIEIDADDNGGIPGRMLQFFHPQTGELVDFPMDIEGAERMGKQLLYGPEDDEGEPAEPPPSPEPPVEDEAEAKPRPATDEWSEGETPAVLPQLS